MFLIFFYQCKTPFCSVLHFQKKNEKNKCCQKHNIKTIKIYVITRVTLMSKKAIIVVNVTSYFKNSVEFEIYEDSSATIGSFLVNLEKNTGICLDKTKCKLDLERLSELSLTVSYIFLQKILKNCLLTDNINAMTLWLNAKIDSNAFIEGVPIIKLATSYEMMELLVNHEADIDAIDLTGETLLTQAIKDLKFKLAMKYIQLNANGFAPNAKQEIPIQLLRRISFHELYETHGERADAIFCQIKMCLQKLVLTS